MLKKLRTLSNNGPVCVELARWNNRLVVVKRLQGASEVLTPRLIREAEVVRKLQHKNIVPLLMTEGTSLIYPYNDGVSLAEVLSYRQHHPQNYQQSQQEKATPAAKPALAENAEHQKRNEIIALQAKRWSLARAATISCDILAALSYSHKQGVIHCDVKPGNIILQKNQALLTDFGFAKDLALVSITQQGMFLGTPNYMSPEQFQGVRDNPKNDLYALGAVFYHMLVGEPPYGNQVLRFLLGDDTVARKPLPQQAAAFAPVIDCALHVDPAKRFADAAQMRQAITDVVVSQQS